MSAPAALLDLAARFGEHIDAYKSGSYNETQLRRDFLDPFFKLLGWDIDNTAGYDEAYRDVIHEDQVRVGGAIKAPDYGFRIGGARKFFLEAKKPSVRIKEDISPAYQLRRYAWSAKLPLSILSDFEEFAIYDTRIKPLPNDPASKARIFYCRFDEYAEKWDYLSSIFSKDAILCGSFDKFAATSKGKRGTSEVDADFLATIENWRADLAKNLALRNPNLSQRELNFAVQRTVDRIIFLRICEDRGIEDYERLKRAAESKAVYPELVKLFQQADDRYNSGLFHFRSEKGRHEDHDTLTPRLVIDDKLLKSIITGLYYPASPYEFSVLSADILGQVYEQFLGKVITLSVGHRAQVEDKPEVKKAGGVFYTPTYIVDYIVRQTVGPLVEGRTPKQIEKLTVLDPACGSGSFLIGAYQFLLDWYHHHYTSHEPGTHAKGKNPKIVAASGGSWALTTTERKRILLAHIYGVDIDSQAVEVTKLSLLLKVLEGETAQTVQRELIHERVLPDLSDNIKCGNSLIGSDFYAQPGLPEMDAEAHLRLNVFDWDGQEGFPEIMKRGGFDAVIGNPPYLNVTDPVNLLYYRENYEVCEGRIDLFETFIEKASALTLASGKFSFIVPAPMLTNQFSRKTRQMILTETTLQKMVTFGYPVFADPTVHTCIFVSDKRAPKKTDFAKVWSGISEPESLTLPESYALRVSELGVGEDLQINVFLTPQYRALLSRIAPICQNFGDLCYVRQCIKTGDDTKYVQERATSPGKTWKPTLRGRDMGRYQASPQAVWINYGNWLARNWANESFYDRPKILVRETGSRITATLDTQKRYVLSSLYSVYPKAGHCLDDIKFLLALINSRFINAIASVLALNATKGAFTKFRTNQLTGLPIRVIDPKNKADQAAHARIVKRVEQMLKLHQDRAAAKTPHEQTVLDRQIAATDKQIDQDVYALYGLTEEEIQLVEG